MAIETINFGLTKDANTDYYNIETANTNMEKIDKALGNTAKFETAGGTGTAIVLTGIDLVAGNSKTFVVSFSNNGAPTTINGKSLYKPGTTQAPKLVAGKAVTVWYNGAHFFFKASAEGNAIAENVLAGKIFSNDDDTGIEGTMPNNGSKTFTPSDEEQSGGAGYYSGIFVKPRPALLGDAVAGDVLAGKSFYNNNYTKKTGAMVDRGTVNHSLPINGSYTIPAGKHSGSGKVTQDISTKEAETITPSTVNKTIAAGQYLSGIQTILGDPNLIPANILSGKKIFGVIGSVIAGLKYATGNTTVSGETRIFQVYMKSDVNMRYITVSGLSFKPKYIIVSYTESASYPASYLYADIVTGEYKYKIDGTGMIRVLTSIVGSGAYVIAGGFLLPITATSNHTWLAIGSE